MKNISFLSIGFAIYWAAFWLLNGFDKFLAGTSCCGITWYGKDRTEQFAGYFERLEIQDASIMNLLYFAGVVEVLVALPFLLVLVYMAGNRLRLSEKSEGMMHLSLFLSFLVFLGFIIFDIVVGDRAELLEHSTYLIVISATFLVSHLEMIFQSEGPAGGIGGLRGRSARR